MKPLSARFVLLCALWLMVPLLSGCAGFTDPLTGNPGEAIDLSPFVGTWTDSSDELGHFEVSEAGENRLRLEWDEDEAPFGRLMTITASLTTIHGQLVASLLYPEEFQEEIPVWALGTVTRGGAGRQWIVRALEPDPFVRAIDSGELPSQEALDRVGAELADYGFVVVDGEDLRSFLLANPDTLAESQGYEVILEPYTGMPAQPEPSYIPDASRYSGAYPDIGYPQPAAPIATPYRAPDAGARQPRQRAGPSSSFVTPTPTAAVGGGPFAGLMGGDQLPIGRLLGALFLILVTGVITVFAVDHLRNRSRRRAEPTVVAEGVNGTPAGGTVYGSPKANPWSLAGLGHYLMPAALILAVAVGPIFFLSLLLRGLALPEWVPGVQPGARETFHDVAPYFVALSFGTMIGVAEVVSAYPAFAWEALRTRWGSFLALLNGLGTVIVYAIVMSYASSFDHPLLRVFAISAGFAILLRTRFVLAGHVSEKGRGEGISVDFGWMYRRLLQLCAQRIDFDLLWSLRYATLRLLTRHPEVETLDRLAEQTIPTREAEAQSALRSTLDGIRAEDVPASLKRARLARFIAETGGRDHVLFLIEHAPAAEPEHAAERTG